MSERKKWFNDRIEKVIFRNKTTCKCGACEIAYKNGLFVNDKIHADYLCQLEAEYNIEGTHLKYFDTIEERDKYEQVLSAMNKVLDSPNIKKQIDKAFKNMILFGNSKGVIDASWMKERKDKKENK
jgi:intergrase/recombinase